MANSPTRRHFLSEEERREAKARAKKRAKHQIQEREHLRLEIEARAIIQRMGATVNTFIQGYEDVTTPVGDVIQQPLSRDRIAALKAASDIDKVLLDRVLPPLKAVEVKKEEAFEDPAKMTDNDLRQTLSKYMGVSKELIDRATGSPSIPKDFLN